MAEKEKEEVKQETAAPAEKPKSKAVKDATEVKSQDATEVKPGKKDEKKIAGEKKAAPGSEEPEEKAAPKARVRRQVVEGMAHIKASFNNTIITITDNQGSTLAWSSGGKIGFKGSRKSTPYAAGLASTDAARKARDMGMKKIRVFVNGPGAGRETAIRSLQHAGIEVTIIKDVTPIPHNGCRPPKRRRV